MANDLPSLRKGWQIAARTDPMFNIVSLGEYEGNRWKPEAFFEHGEQEVRTVLDSLPAWIDYQAAFDFGCGMGRTTQALAKRFARVTGVDISPEMIRLASKHNQHGRRVVYRVVWDSLARFRNYDLVYSTVVLQHMSHELQRNYIGQFLRLLKPHGVANFQLPEGPEGEHANNWLSMYGTPRATVRQWVRAAGGRVIDIEEWGVEGPWLSLRYTVGQR